jgi:diphthamide synthase (EF-2-diphthine--ammonia ligase)
MSASYRVLALVSGGKDSCYSMIECVSAGHQIVGLANLRPLDEDGKLSKISIKLKTLSLTFRVTTCKTLLKVSCLS